MQRESTILPPPPRLERSPPAVPAVVSSRLSRRNGVPPNIPNLFEHASVQSRSTPLPPPPPPVPHSRNYYTLGQREPQLRDRLDELHEQTARLQRDHENLIRHGSRTQASDLWTEDERRTLLETAAAARSHRPRSHIIRARSGQPSLLVRSSEPQADDDEWRSAFEPIAIEPAESAEGQLSEDPNRRTVLPTPPLDQSEQGGDSLFVPENRAATSRPLHPLSRSWSANGLGDRNRSPSPGDAWEIMETTIEPDATLPSADSSFGTVPATSSFASSNDTTITEPERGPLHSYGANDHANDESDSDSSSSIDLDCTDEEYLAQAESFAREMYDYEMSTIAGRERIRPIVLSMTSSSSRTLRPVDLGFRLIDDALNTSEGRARVASLHGEDAIHRIVRFRNQSHSTSPPATYRPHSPPSTSHDPPSANPVSPPSQQQSSHAVQSRTNPLSSSYDDVLDPDSDEQEDIDQMRRVARRFATRDEVPDDWWASMGLNSSIARDPRLGSNSRRAGRSPDGVRRVDMRSNVERAIGRVREGRVERERERERGNSRL